MIETKTDLLKGKSTLIKNKQYLSASDYVTPFFNKMDVFKPTYIIKAKKADQISGTESNPDIIYNKVHIQAILPEEYYFKSGCKKCVGFIYSLDSKIPVSKFYIGNIDNDEHFYAFDYDLNVQKIEESTPINYNPISELMSKTDISETMIDQIKNTVYSSKKDLIKKIGEWVDFTLNKFYIDDYNKIKLSTNIPVNTYKLLTDKDSDYYIDDNAKNIYIDDVYCALSSLIKDDKDIVNYFEKTVLFSKMLNL